MVDFSLINFTFFVFLIMILMYLYIRPAVYNILYAAPYITKMYWMSQKSFWCSNQNIHLLHPVQRKNILNIFIFELWEKQQFQIGKDYKRI